MKKIIIALAIALCSTASGSDVDRDASQAIVNAWGVDEYVQILATPIYKRPMWFRVWTETAGCAVDGRDLDRSNCWSRI